MTADQGRAATARGAAGSHSVRWGLLLPPVRRPGEPDHSLLTLQGRSLLSRNLDFLTGRFAAAAVVRPRARGVDLGDGEPRARLVIVDAGFGMDARADATDDMSLAAALRAGLSDLGEPSFVLAADMPFPSHEAIDALLQRWDGQAAACLPAVGGELVAHVGVYHPRCLPALADAEDGAVALSSVLAALDPIVVPFPDPAPFTRLWSLADYERARRSLSPTQRPFPGPAATDARPALVAVVGKSDSGKTTVVERLLPELRRLGLLVGTVKHDAHDFEIDHPGTDSYRHGAAGSPAYTIASPHRLAHVAVLEEELPLVEIVRRFYPGYDLVLAEGYKRQAPHRIEIFRAGAGHREPLSATEPMLALMTDTDAPHEHRFALDDIEGLAAFIALRLDSLRDY
jgi:molybdopterin-guanine dinucleotide biosynthesis protein B